MANGSSTEAAFWEVGPTKIWPTAGTTYLFLEAHEVVVQTAPVTVNCSVGARDIQSVVAEAVQAVRQ